MMLNNWLFLLDSAAGGAPQGDMTFIFLPLILIVFFFFILRPQMKRNKEERKFRENIQKGDKVMTIGGIYGVIETIDEETILLRVDKDMKLRLDKTALRAVPAAGKK